jgi:hypothetical protein
MTNTVRNILIVTGSTISAGIIGITGWAIGKKQGFEAGCKQAAAELNGTSEPAPRNTRRDQAQA